MTAQSPDFVMYQGQQFEYIFDQPQLSITTNSPKRLRNMQKLGFTDLFWTSTANRRGYQASYSVIDHVLYLTSLEICDKSGLYPILGDVEPYIKYGCAIYENMMEKVTFSGTVAIGNNCRKDYVCSLTDFKTVMKLTFSKGLLVGATDISQEVSSIYEKIKSIQEEMKVSASERHRNLRWAEINFLQTKAHKLAGATQLALVLAFLDKAYAKLKYRLSIRRQQQ